MSQAEQGIGSTVQPARAESQVLIVGTSAALSFWVTALLAIANADDRAWMIRTDGDACRLEDRRTVAG